MNKPNILALATLALLPWCVHPYHVLSGVIRPLSSLALHVHVHVKYRVFVGCLFSDAIYAHTGHCALRTLRALVISFTFTSTDFPLTPSRPHQPPTGNEATAHGQRLVKVS